MSSARLATALLALLACGAQAGPLRIDRAEMAPLLGKVATAWHPVRLPDAWDRAPSPRPAQAAYRLNVQLDRAPDEPYALYIPRAGNRAEVRLNGETLEHFGNLDVASADYGKLPLFVVAPVRLLKTGTNEVEIRVAAERGLNGGLSAVWFGSESEVKPMYHRRMLWLSTGSLVVASVCVILGLLALTIAWRLRDRLFAVFGIAALIWAFRMAHVLVAEPEIPIAWWNAIVGAAYGWHISLICLFALDALAIRGIALRRSLALFAVATTFVAVWTYLGSEPQLWKNWVLVMLVMAGAVGVAVVRRTIQRPSVEGVLLSLSAAIGIASGLRDYMVYLGTGYGSFSITRYVALAFVLAMTWILIDRFARAMRAEADANRMLSQRVEEKERELAANYDRLRRLERERAATEERQRIMQDMHDGLGSQLLSSLALVERGALDRQGMAQLLREAIDDMRLAIDTLAPGREGLLEALGNLRYRLEPRFRAAGTELRFALHDLPDRLDVPPDAALQILRVLQEALTNALKHAHPSAVEVEVSVQHDAQRFALVVRDDGTGFEPDAVAAGRGLTGMRRRAQAIGAALDIVSGSSGTRVALSYPIPAPK